jgi:Xaa-Pro aminopeptidase
MKSDLDRMMMEAGLDALLINGAANHSTAMVYFTGVLLLLDGYLIKKRDNQPILVCRAMEREEAARTGFQIKVMDEYDPIAILDEVDGDQIQAQARILELILEEFDVKGRVSVYGKVELGAYVEVYRLLKDKLPEVEIIGESTRSSILGKARMTKSEEEVDEIRKMGQITTQVVGNVADFLTSHKVEDETLMMADGNPLTIGEVKKRINVWLAMYGAENPKGTLFGMGRDGGIPHSSGTDTDVIQLGKPIVFDIFPCQQGGGYFYDHTRTWCLGYAPDEVVDLYNDVAEVYIQVIEAIKMNTPARDYQILICDLFHNQGHPTQMEDSKIQIGYCHSLGHGVGLNVQEPPFFDLVDSNKDIIQPGSVFTLEPGLYYPDRGMGVRLEDTFWMRPDGVLEKLSNYPTDLVLEMKDNA